MRRRLRILLLIAIAIMASAGQGWAQPKQTQCERGVVQPRNWEMIGIEYVYFDYDLCPPGISKPLVRIWITMRGYGIAVEKVTEDRDGADQLTVYNGKKKLYTIYRDLKAVPPSVFKPERRSGVPSETASQPFTQEGSYLVPLENLTDESAELVNRVFTHADGLVKTAQRKVNLLFESPKIVGIVKIIDEPLKQRK